MKRIIDGVNRMPAIKLDDCTVINSGDISSVTQSTHILIIYMKNGQRHYVDDRHSSEIVSDLYQEIEQALQRK